MNPTLTTDAALLEDRTAELASKVGIAAPRWQRFMSLIGDLKNHNIFMYNHSLRVGIYTQGLALSEHDIDPRFALFAGCGHDIGKSDVANELLDSKNLQPHEFEQIKVHPTSGFARLKNEFLYTAYVAGLHHKFKPGGYGIELDDVAQFPLSPASKHKIESMAKLVMLADFYDALTTRKDNKGLIKNQHDKAEQTAVLLEYFPDSAARIDWLVNHRLSSP